MFAERRIAVDQQRPICNGAIALRDQFIRLDSDDPRAAGPGFPITASKSGEGDNRGIVRHGGVSPTNYKTICLTDGLARVNPPRVVYAASLMA